MTVLILKNKNIVEMRGSTSGGDYIIKHIGQEIGTYELNKSAVLKTVYNQENTSNLKSTLINKYPEYFV